MDANSMLARHWEDVVFEYRNKAYGAYLLRRAYSQRLMAGLATTLIILALVLSLQRLYSGDEITAAPALLSEQEGHALSQPPSLARKLRGATRHSPVVSTRDRPIVVTHDPVDQPEEDFTREFIPDDNLPGGAGTFDGEGTVPVVEAPAPAAPAIVDFAEVMPRYEGGTEAMMKFIQKKIHYPRVPRQMGIEGTVYVRFVVNGDGTISGVEIIKGVHPDCDEEAMRVISMLPGWKGGSHNGRPVGVRMVLPIRFSLRGQ